MTQFKDAYTEHQLKRWMRPDAWRFVRPDWQRFVRPGYEHEFPFELYERKYSPDQPRVPAGNPDGGQWTSGVGSETAGQGTQIAARVSPEREAECELQYREDRNICRIMGTESCWAQAAFRYSQCLIGGYIPRLFH
jgi:hypothetical protein